MPKNFLYWNYLFGAVGMTISLIWMWVAIGLNPAEIEKTSFGMPNWIYGFVFIGIAVFFGLSAWSTSKKPRNAITA